VEGIMNKYFGFLPEVGLPYYLSVKRRDSYWWWYRPFSNDDFSLEWSTDKLQ